MRSDELLTRLRLNATLEDSAVDYPDSVLLAELNDSMSTTFEAMVVKARAGFWLDTVDVTVTSPQPKYRIPPRSCVQGLEKIEISTAGSAYSRLPEVSEAHAETYTSPASALGAPQKFVVRGDQVVLLPNPDASGWLLRFYFYRRPSRLVTQQSSTLNGGTSRGKVLGVNTTLRTITVDAIPFDMEAVSGGVVTPAAIVSGVSLIDVVHPNGWHECAIINQLQTYTGTTLTLTGTDDMSEIAVGDYVRAAEQTDWAMIPSDFHRCLADTTAVKVLAQRNMADKAADFAQAVSADIQRFQDILEPRVKSGALTIKAPLYAIRGRPRWYWPGFP
jgi:hypothetical protein